MRQNKTANILQLRREAVQTCPRSNKVRFYIRSYNKQSQCFSSGLNWKKSSVTVPESLIVAPIISCYYLYHSKCLVYSCKDGAGEDGLPFWPGIYFAAFLRKKMRGEILNNNHSIHFQKELVVPSCHLP